VNCERLEDRLDDYLDGRLSDVERRAADEHLAGCTGCAGMVRTLREALADLPASDVTAFPVPPALAASIVEHTSGSACERAQGLLVDFVDAALGADDASLVRTHVEHCARCSALRRALVWLEKELPELATMDPGPAFTREVVLATVKAPGAPRRPAWHEAFTGVWRRLVARPRFAWEAAYVGLLILVALFGTSISPFRAVPSRALAVVQLDPRILVRTAYDDIGMIGARLWDVSAGRLAMAARDQASDVADHHPGMHEAYGSWRVHCGDLRQSMGDRNFASASLAMNNMGDDLHALWTSWARTSTPPPPAPSR